MEEPELKPKHIPAIELQGHGRVRIQIGEAFFVVRDVEFEYDPEEKWTNAEPEKIDLHKPVAVKVWWVNDDGDFIPATYLPDQIIATLPRILFRIPDHKLEDLRGKIEKANKRARKRGLTPIYFEEVEKVEEILYMTYSVWDGESLRISKEMYDATKRDYPYDSTCYTEVRRFTMVKLIGESPHYNGWRAMAVLEHLPAGTLVHAIGESDVPEKYRENDNFCDHCKAKRKRKKTLVIEHENGETKRIGLNCAADFVSVKSATQLVGNAELWATFMKSFAGAEEGDWKAREPEPDALHYLPWVAQSIRQNSWVPRSRADQACPTADDALWLMFPSPLEKPDVRAERERRGRPTEIDFQRARKGLEWARGLVGKSDFEHNIKVLAGGEWFPKNRAGYVAYFVQGHLRELAAKQEEKRVASGPKSEWVGEVKGRVELGVMCTGARTIKGAQWDSIMYRFTDDNGNLFVWFTSTDFKYQEWVCEGVRYNIRSTVKSHDEFKGIKQTKLTRTTFPEVKQADKSGMTPEEFLNRRQSA